MRITISTKEPWIELNKMRGSNNDSIFITVDSADLSHGSYFGSIMVTSNGGDEQVIIEFNVPSPTPNPTPAITTTPTPTPTVFPITYKVWIDSDYGFREVRAVNGTTNVPLPSNFDDLNVTINTGDKVIWINDDSYDFPLTVVSNEGLFTNQTGRLRYRETRVEYTFNRSGSYTFSIKEYPNLKNQKIHVN